MRYFDGGKINGNYLRLGLCLEDRKTGISMGSGSFMVRPFGRISRLRHEDRKVAWDWTWESLKQLTPLFFLFLLPFSVLKEYLLS